MGNLIKNEIIKVLKKKSFYVMLIIILGFIIFTNALYKYVYSNNKPYDNSQYISRLEEINKTLDLSNEDEAYEFIENKTEIEIYELTKDLDGDSWQYEIINDKARTLIYNINYYTYIEKDTYQEETAKTEYNEFLKLMKLDDWKAFANKELKELEETKNQGQFTDEHLEQEIEKINMRLKYNIEYGYNYKNSALDRYFEAKRIIKTLEKKEEKTYEQEQEYQNAKADFAKSKYVIENDKNIFDENNARGMLLTVFLESGYGLFIILTVVLISGAIVSEEFNKGTIKLLLVRPYSRIKILMAKFVVVLLTIIITMLIIAILQLIIGGIFFGFSSLKIPVVEYNYKTETLIEINIFKKVAMTAVEILPEYILLGTLAFSLSTIFTNSALAIIVSMVGYLVSNTINSLAIYYNVKWLKYFVTLNWDFTQFEYGKLAKMEGITSTFSTAICIVYFAIMLITAITVFKKKNIKTIYSRLLLTVNSDAFVISFVNFLSPLSRSQISRSCVLPAGLLSGRFQRPHGSKACRRTAHSQPVPPGLQPPQIRRSRKCQTSHALPQRQKAVVHPCVGEAEQVRGESRQHRRKAGVAEGEPRIAGHHPPALRKRKPCRKPQRHRTQHHHQHQPPPDFHCYLHDFTSSLHLLNFVYKSSLSQMKPRAFLLIYGSVSVKKFAGTTMLDAAETHRSGHIQQKRLIDAAIRLAQPHCVQQLPRLIEHENRLLRGWTVFFQS